MLLQQHWGLFTYLLYLLAEQVRVARLTLTNAPRRRVSTEARVSRAGRQCRHLRRAICASVVRRSTASTASGGSVTATRVVEMVGASQMTTRTAAFDATVWSALKVRRVT